MPDPTDRTYIAFDLDGTLAEHYWPLKGLYDHKRVGDPIPQMVQFVKYLISKGRECRILTARVVPANYHDHDAEEAREAIEAWCEKHIGQKLVVQCHKDYLMESLFDDRAYNVALNTGKVASKNGVYVDPMDFVIYG